MFEFLKSKTGGIESGSHELALRLQNEAEYLNENDEPKKALRLCLKAYEICTSLYGEKHDEYKPLVASCSNLLGNIYNNLNKYDQSYAYHHIAYELYNELSADGNEEYSELLADEYDNIGDTFFFTDNYDEAERNYKNALEIYTKLYEKDNAKYAEDMAYCYDCLAKAYSGEENYTASVEAYEKVIAIFKSLIPDDLSDSPDEKELDFFEDLAEAYNDLGYVYSCEDQLENTEKYYLEASKIYRQLVRTDAYEYSCILSEQYKDLAALYEDMGNFKLASEYEKKAKKLCG